MTLAKCLFASVCLIFSTLAVAAEEYALVKTEMGCSVFVLKSLLETQARDQKSATRQWNGECVDGLASGRGKLTHNWNQGEGDYLRKNTTSTEGNMDRGKWYGYIKNVVRSENANRSAELNKTLHESYSFAFDGEWAFGHGLGLEFDEALYADSQLKLPRRISVALGETVLIAMSGMGTLLLQPYPCALDTQRFPDCGFDEGKQNYDVNRFHKLPPYRGQPFDPKSLEYVYCPEPKRRTSCEALAAELAGPFVKAVEAFIAAALPKIKDIEASLRVGEAEKARKLVEANALKAESAAQERQKKNVADVAFQAQLDVAPVGELFAMADEQKAIGNLVNCRAALRKLMGRFPDHKLALLAAQMLTDLQGK